ncbi:DNA-binding response regulator [Streptomyces spiroverticillatus]|uniref:DNA-binding response regulator n=1 Tax=Streptomyces finlayi TaxID=67296 RepID=A0A919CAZ2_9ACTN|nr:response regulator transcription factor [Streptomyces finlayi]GHA14732.1 DNA-binding response regulator [Streptomyces spiroverticillatus]GHC97147.1 DNA-binding response regulator [Streptomyces finlayi]
MRQLRIVLAEDAVLLREGLVSLLERFGHSVPAAVGDGPSLVAAAREHRPDLVVADVRMPPAFRDEGLRAVRELQGEQPHLAAVVLSQYVEQTFAEELLESRHGAGTGYLLKDRVGDVEEFMDALVRVADGGMVVDPEVVRQLLARRRDPLGRITPREREVLGLMAEGRSNAAIARALVVTEAAVAKHIAGILQKLDLPPAPDDHRRVLAVLAYLRG